jgi:hypothetical protein
VRISDQYKIEYILRRVLVAPSIQLHDEKGKIYSNMMVFLGAETGVLVPVLHSLTG